MKEKKQASYYEASSAGLHAFLTRALDKIVARCPSGIKTGAITMGRLYSLDKFARENKAKAVPFLDWIPNGGLLIGTKTYKYKKQRSIIQEICYEFRGLFPTPVYAVNLNFLTLDYGALGPISASIIIAKNKVLIEKFLEEYTRADHGRVRKKAVVLNHRGSEMKGFRKMSWDEIVLPGTMKEDIRREVEDFFKNKKVYEQYGLAWRRGILLAGSPGNGKTSICRAIASTSTVPIIYSVLGDHDTFGFVNSVKETLERYAPCIVIFEDADSLGGDDALRAALLNMLDGFFSSTGILAIASTNCAEKLDIALTGRPSRFDSFFLIPNPGTTERERLLRDRLKKMVRLTDKEWQAIMSETDGLSSASIQEVAVSALLEALRAKSKVRLTHLLAASAKVRQHMDYAKNGIEKAEKGNAGFGLALPSKRAMLLEGLEEEP